MQLTVPCSACGAGVEINLDALQSRLTIETEHTYGGQEDGLHARSGRADPSDAGSYRRRDALALTAKEKAYIQGFIAGCAAAQTAFYQDPHDAPKQGDT